MIKTLTFLTAALLVAGVAQAAVVDVDAKAAAIGTAGATATLAAGDSFEITASSLDLWRAGAGQLFSNADGLNGTIVAVAGDDSGYAPGTVIGKNWGSPTIGGATFSFGQLVGQIDDGAYFAVGTDYKGTTATGGTLHLYFWDTFYGDNSGSIAATVTSVPEPASLALMLAGVGMIGGLALRRSRR